MASTRPSAPPSFDRVCPGPTKVRKARDASSRVGRSLSREAEELLFCCAEILTEGSLASADRFFGSTMITFDLERLSGLVRGLDREGAEAELFHLVGGSVRVRLRAMRIACAEARRRAPDRTFGTMLVDTRMRYAPGRIYVDLDVEAPVAALDREEHG